MQQYYVDDTVYSIDGDDLHTVRTSTTELVLV